MRCSVISSINRSTESAGLQVRTLLVITDVISRPRAEAPCEATARTTSRSDTMPAMVDRSGVTTSAPMRRSRSSAAASASEASTPIVATSDPLRSRMDRTFIAFLLLLPLGRDPTRDQPCGRTRYFCPVAWRAHERTASGASMPASDTSSV